MLRLSKRYGNGKNNYVVAECDVVSDDKPVWYVFTGDGANGDNDLNGYLKFVVDIQKNKLERDYAVDGLYDKVDFYAIRYSERKRGFCGPLKYSMTDSDICEFLYYRIVPLFYDNKNQLLKKEDIKKRLIRINIFSHCYGSNVVYNIFEELIKIIVTQAKLECACVKNRQSDLCNEDDVREVLKSIRHISYAPINEKINLPTVRVRPLRDGIVENGNLLPYRYKDLCGEFLDGVDTRLFDNGEGLLGKNDDCVKAKSLDIYSSKMLNTIDSPSPANEHLLFQLKKDSNGNLIPVVVFPWFDFNPEEILCKNAEDISNMLEVVMADATKCSLDNYNSQNEIIIPRTQLSDLKTRIDMINNSYLTDEIKSDPKSYQTITFRRLLD